jgi:hypothetical protein
VRESLKNKRKNVGPTLPQRNRSQVVSGKAVSATGQNDGSGGGPCDSGLAPLWPTALIIEFGPDDLGSRSGAPLWMQVREAVESLQRDGAPSPSMIARRMGMPVKNVYGAIFKACRLGLIERRGAGRSTAYRAPAIHADAPQFWAQLGRETVR